MDSKEQISLYNITSEEQVLGSILYSPELLQELMEVLNPDDFYKQSHKAIYKTMIECCLKGIEINLITLSTELKEKGYLEIIGGATYLTTLMTPSASITKSSTLYHAEKIIEARKKRNLYNSLIEIGSDMTMSWEEIQKQIEKKLLDQTMDNKTEKSKFTSIAERIEDMKNTMEQYYKNQGKNIGLTTGFPKLIHKCPIIQGDYIVLAGASRLGKTTFGLNLVYNIARAERKHTAFVSCEMSREEIELRLQSLYTGCSVGDIMFGRIGDPNLVVDFEGLSSLPILISYFGTATVDKIRNSLRLLKIKYPDLCFVVIDAVNYLVDNRQESRAQELTDISRKIRDMANQLNIAIMLICQIPYSAKGRKPTLEDIKGSGSIGYDCDTAWFLWQDTESFIKQEEKDRIKIELLIEKQRRGIWGRKYELLFIPSKMYFGEL